MFGSVLSRDAICETRTILKKMGSGGHCDHSIVSSLQNSEFGILYLSDLRSTQESDKDLRFLDQGQRIRDLDINFKIT